MVTILNGLTVTMYQIMQLAPLCPERVYSHHLQYVIS